MKRWLLLLVLVVLSGCATVAPPASPPATRADLNAALYAQTVDITLADGTRYGDARAVIVAADSVRFVADGASSRGVTALALADVVDISQPGRSTRGVGILPGLGAGVGLGIAFQQIAPDAWAGSPQGTLTFVGIGGALGWWLGDRRAPAAERRVLYPLSP